MRFPGVPSVLAVLVVLAGCGGDGGTTTVTLRETVTETGAGTVPNEAPTVLRVYFLRDRKVAPVSRAVVTGSQPGAAALGELFKGPTTEEGLETAIPAGTELESLTIDGGVASVQLSEQPTQDDALAQIVYTLTQFPTVTRVDVGSDAPVGRADFEDETPAILVESPLPSEEVEPGFEVTGTANTFEATFEYELKDAAGKVLNKNFVTATSGTGTRGTFEFTVPYEVAQAQQGTLTVFEISAANGSRTHESSIPLRLR